MSSIDQNRFYKSKKQIDDENFHWKKDPYFMVAPHLSDLDTHYVYRRLSPVSYQEIEVKIIKKKIYPERRLTDSETAWIEKNLI